MLNDFRETPPEVASIMGVVDTFVRWKNKNLPDRGYEIYHPSAFGKCLRCMQYKRYAERGIIQVPEEDFDSRILRLFETGHHMQSRWEKYFTEMGILRGIWVCANPVCKKHNDDGTLNEHFENGSAEWMDKPENKPRTYGLDNKIGCFKPEKCACGSTRFYYNEVPVRNDELNFAGHADLILDFSEFNPDMFNGTTRTFNLEVLPKNPIVVDMKTINSKGFANMVKYGKPPSLEYQIQLTIYSNMLDCEYGLLIYECKDDSDTAAYKIPRNQDTWWELIKKQALLMNKMTEIKDEDTGKILCLLPPPRPTDKSCYECKGCQFRKLCHKSKIWNDPALDEKRNKFYGFLLND